MNFKNISIKQWIKYSIITILYVLFCIWVENLWLLLGIILITDIYITKFVPWGGWKNMKNKRLVYVLKWVDDIIFCLIAVQLIFTFLFQNYQIPTSSLEKSLLVGDYLLVSKLSYGPRIPNTPIAFPLVQNTFPISGNKSYLEWPNWGYKRIKGLGKVKRNDIVVFNFPAGDTIAVKKQNPDYYSLVSMEGRERIKLDHKTFGDIMYRPVDRRENYVKRCIGMPGDSLQIINNDVYINGQRGKDPKNIQYNYYVETDGTLISDKVFYALGISKDDQNLVSNYIQYHGLLNFMKFEPVNGNFKPIYRLPLTHEAKKTLESYAYIKQIKIEPEEMGGSTYPLSLETGWTRDNYGPIWIPKKGATITLNEKNIALYSRCIKNYEGNTLEFRDNKIFINNQPADSYTFKYDYYFMMGDNRHNSADSRSWGFVPEDHIVGKPILVWLSLNKDRSLFNGKIRWNRFLRKPNAL